TRAPVTDRHPSGCFSRRRRSPNASGCRANSPARRRATADGSCGRGPGETSGSSPSSRTGSPRSPPTTSTLAAASQPPPPAPRRRRDDLSREAVELARRSADLATLAYALDGRISAIIAPDTQEEVFELATEMGAVGARIADHELVVHSQSLRLFSHVLRGEMDEAEGVLAAVEPV